MAIVYLSVGSNMGDKLKNIQQCYMAIEKTSTISILKKSGFYRTQPVDYLDQDWFVNGAIKVETDLAPTLLLKTLKALEKESGQESKTVRFGPRIIDLDIIFYDDLILKTDTLEIPHPRMAQRVFVLKPMCDLNADFVHPVTGLKIGEILEALSVEGQAVEKLI
jgi:2-amino-4-hydroxy-6-hydroxymethyldihydropteridine diphosphokinase